MLNKCWLSKHMCSITSRTSKPGCLRLFGSVVVPGEKAKRPKVAAHEDLCSSKDKIKHSIFPSTCHCPRSRQNTASSPLPATVQGNLPVQAPDISLPGTHDPTSVGHSDCIWKRKDHGDVNSQTGARQPPRACEQWPHLWCTSASMSYLHACSFLLHSLPDPAEGRNQGTGRGSRHMIETKQDSAYPVRTVTWRPQSLLPCPCRHGATLRDKRQTLLWTEDRHPRRRVGENWRSLCLHSSVQFYFKGRKDSK